MDGIEHTNGSKTWQDRNPVSLETNQGFINATTFGDRNNGTQVASLHAQHSTINIGAQQQNQKDDTEFIRKFLRLLAFEEMYFRENDIKDWTPETCTWLYEDAEFRHWLMDLGLLIIRGKPGSGKSTIMKFIINEVVPSSKKASNDIITASFFFSARGAALQHTASGMFRSLLHQLITNNSAYLLNLIVRLVNLESSQAIANLTSNRNQLRSQLKRVIFELLKSSPICLYVDALDECDEDSLDDIRLFFEEIINRSQAQVYSLGICVSCRPYPNVFEVSDYTIVVDKNNTQDIRRRIQHQFKSVKMREYNQIILEEAISSKAAGVFQWVDLVLPHILKLHDKGKGIKPMLNEIDTIPQELEILYSKALAELDEAELIASWRLFAWVRFAERLLSLDELRYAIVFGIDLPHKSIQEYLELEDICEDAEQMERRIRHLSKGLIEVKQQGNQLVAQFIHQSASDFVQKSGMKEIYRKLRKTSTEDTDPIAHAHFDLSRSCIRFMLMGEALKNCEDQKRWENGLFPHFLYSLLDYATSNWVIHAERSEARGLSQADLLEHFQWPSAHLIRCWSLLRKRVSYTLYRRPGRWHDIPGEPYGDTTLLHVACDYNLVSVITKILEISQLINSRIEFLDRPDYQGNTALHIAVRRDNGRINRTSPEARMVLYQSSVRFFSPHYTKASTTTWGVASTVELLLDHGANTAAINDSCETPLHDAIRYGNLGIVKQLLPIGAEFAVANERDETPLHVAAGSREIEVVKLLLAQGADIAAVDKAGETPIYRAASEGPEEIVELLLAQGADSAVANKTGSTPLHVAAKLRRTEVVKVLLDHGADFRRTDCDGRTPLHLVTESSESSFWDYNVIHLLTEHGAGYAVTDKDGMTPLLYVLRYNKETELAELAELLLERGADITIPDERGWTPLHHISSSWRSPEIAKRVLELGADLTAVDENGMTPLHIAMLKANGIIAMLLLDNGADITIPCKTGKTPLQYAESPYIIRYLLEHGADLKVVDKDNMTPFHSAVCGGFSGLVGRLLEAGAEMNFLTKDSMISRGIVIKRQDYNCGIWSLEDYQKALQVLETTHTRIRKF